LVLLADLAAIYQDLERYGEAEILLQRLIEIKQAARARAKTSRAPRFQT